MSGGHSGRKEPPHGASSHKKGIIIITSRQAVEADNSGASQPDAAGKPADPDSELAAMSAKDSVMQAIRTLGRLPKETRTATKDERQLALGLRRARQASKQSGEEEAELAAMSANEDSLMQAIRALGRLPKDTRTDTKDE